MSASHEHLTALPGTGLAAGLAPAGHIAVAAAALIAALTVWAVLTAGVRKRITWTMDLDMPVRVAPGRAPGAWTMTFGKDGARPAAPDPDSAAEGWLVLLTITNTGIMPVRGNDFRVPLAFQFPGREVCAARISLEPASPHASRRPLVLAGTLGDPGCGTAAGASRDPGVALGSDLLLNRNDAVTLIAVLCGTPAPSLPPAIQEGSLPGGTIAAADPDRPPASRWGSAHAATAVMLAAALLSLLPGAGSS